MKKLLTTLSLFSVVGSSSSMVVSCNQKAIKFDMSKFKLNWYDLYNQNITKTNDDLYQNVADAIWKTATDQKTYGQGTIWNDYENNKTLHISILNSNGEEIKDNWKTQFDISKLPSTKIDVKISVDKSDQYFNESKEITKSVDINPINQENVSWLKDTVKLDTIISHNHKDHKNPITGKQTSSSWYTDVRYYFADNMNDAKGSDQSSLTNENIKSDPNLGISIWSKKGILSDNNDPIDLADITELKIIIKGKNIDPNPSGWDKYFNAEKQDYFHFTDKKTNI